MGGAVSNVAKKISEPITKVIKKAEGKPSEGGFYVPAKPSAPVQGKDEAAETLAARRRARRGGRALLSEERLAPEAGVGQSTLGAGPMA